MQSPRKPSEYAQRMNRVLDHIDRHLDSALDLESLAEIAHFSPFHFHRMFSAWMGETLGDYLRRRRLDMAAAHLANQPHIPVLTIALGVGFGSGEAFARAFRQRFGCTPTEWRVASPQRWAEELARQRRRDSNLDQDQRKPDQSSAGCHGHHGDSLNKEFTMDIKLVNFAPVRVAYLRRIGAYGPGVTAFWQQTVWPWIQAHGLENAARYGVGHDDPGITAPDKCRYDACVAVPDDFVATSPANIAVLPGGRYASAHFRGPAPLATQAWTELLRDWLPSSGMQPDGRPFFEYYPSDAYYDIATATIECQLCLPVRPL
ncbi:AraC family transcriptional regulator [Chitinimonas lacunae]|uniref:GyrI-like domain-containing protein n=1 Tax=Chitinimonas lacunae TaxID=1963018 RepID=A0ABV8MUG3_9NEIS